MRLAERDAVIEECAVVAENELDGNHDANLRAKQIAELLRAMKSQPPLAAESQ